MMTSRNDRFLKGRFSGLMIAAAILCCASAFSTALANGTTKSKPEEIAKLIPHETEEQYNARMSWWIHDRFGMFIHFGLYAAPARHEWVKKTENLDNKTYDRYFTDYNPDLFDAKEWAKTAKRAGMKYCVLTAKHHEGFCMFDSKFTDYKITKTPFGRDLVKEYVEAFRAEGIKVGFYYSLIDWHHPDFTLDSLHPQWGKVDRETFDKGRDMDRYRRYMLDQVTELLTNYGRIDIIWFDFSYPGENGKGRDDWDSAAIYTLARKLQPHIIIDNRLDLNDVPGGTDFITPEQYNPSTWPKLDGRKYAWETCQTFSGSWGYSRDEMNWKSAKQTLYSLIAAVAHGGNLIMNVGPTARGEFDARAKARLDDYAKWMHANSRSIYGCTEAPEKYKAPEGTLLTWNPETKRLYIHFLFYPAGQLGINFGKDIRYAQFLHDASEVKVALAGQGGSFCDNESGFDAHLFFPAVHPPVEIPVIECMMK